MSLYRKDGFTLKRMADVRIVFYALKRSRLRDDPVSSGDSPFQLMSGVPDWEGEAGEPWEHTREEITPGRKGREVAVAPGSRGSVCCFTTQGRGRTPRGGPRGAPTEAGSWALRPSAPPKSSASPATFYRTGRAATPAAMME